MKETISGEFSFDMFYGSNMVSVAWQAEVIDGKVCNVTWEITEGTAVEEWFSDMLHSEIEQELQKRNNMMAETLYEIA